MVIELIENSPTMSMRLKVYDVQRACASLAEKLDDIDDQFEVDEKKQEEILEFEDKVSSNFTLLCVLYDQLLSSLIV